MSAIEPSRFNMAFRHSYQLGQRQNVREWTVCRIAHERWCPPTAFDRVDTPWRCIAVVLDGAGVFTTAAGAMQLAVGSVFFFAPGGRHAYRSLPGCELEIIIIEFEAPDADAVMASCLGGLRGVVRCQRHDLIADAARLCFASVRDSVAYGERAAAHIVQGLLYLIAGERQADPGHGDGQRHLAARACAVMQQQWNLIGSAAEVAAACGISHTYLCRVFRRHVGITPQAYLTQIRMRHAAHALVASQHGLAALAHEFGFEDAFAFSRCFKRVIGLAPQHYRGRGQAPE